MEIIHIVLGKANPNRMNGVNKVVYQLSNKQFEHNEKVSVWGITNDLTENYGERDFETKLFKKSINPFTMDKELKSEIQKKAKNAIFHIHGGWIPLFSSISKFLKKNNTPFVYTPHGAYNTIAMKKSWLTKKIYFELFEKSLIKNAEKIHCIGNSEVLGLNSIYKTDKTILLPYGYELNKERLETENTNKEMIIGFVGRIDIYTKGLDLLLESFKKFQSKVQNSKLWIIGDGSDNTKLLEMIGNLGIKPHVVVFGSKFGLEKDMLIKQMNVFTHPSRNEGLPSAVLEASNFGIPCIVSKATNVSEYIKKYESGYEVENENIESLKNAFFKIHELWKNNDLNRMKHNSQKMVISSFNWDVLIPEFKKLYKN